MDVMDDDFDALDDGDDGGSSLLAGVVSGALGGLAGVWIMAQVDDILEMTLDETKLGRHARPPSAKRLDDPLGVDLPPADKPAMRAARSIAGAAGYEISDEQARKAAPAFEYGFGAALGALYGGLAEFAPWATSGRGALFGAGLWAGMDLVALPRLGLSDRPESNLVAAQARAFTRRAAWSLTADAVRRMVRALF